MIFSKVDLPEPLSPNTPILAPGKKLSEMSLRMCRLGGTILPTRFMVNTYWAMRKILGTRLKSGDYQPCTAPQPRHFNSCDNENRCILQLVQHQRFCWG